MTAITLTQIAQGILDSTTFAGKAKDVNTRPGLWNLAHQLSGQKLQRSVSDTGLIAVIIASLIVNAEKEQFMNPGTDSNINANDTNIVTAATASTAQASRYASAYAIELVDATGALAIPRFVSFQTTQQLVNKIEHATLFTSYDSALQYLSSVTLDPSVAGPSGMFTVTLTTYNVDEHTRFWELLNKEQGTKITDVLADTYTEPLLTASEILAEVADKAEKQQYGAALALLETANRMLLDAYGRITVKAFQRDSDH